MAIKWGSWRSNSTGNSMRLGYDLTQSPTSVGTGTSSVVVTLKVYFESAASISDSSNSYSISGNFSGSGSASISHGGSGGTTLIRTLTRTVTTSYTSTVGSSFSASISGINAISGTASVSGSWTTAKRPISPPAAVSGVNITRNSDTSHTVKWTNNSPTNAGAPYQNIEVQRWDNVGNTWSTIVTLGVTTSYTNTSTRADRQYRWRVRSKNSAGASAYIYSGYWSTTPAPPGTPKASKTANDIKLTWTNYATKGDGIEVWHATNGVWDGSVLAVLSGQPTTWTHTAPNPAQTHTYRIKSKAGQSDDAPTTYSAMSAASNVIQLLTNPAAPTKLSPASGVVDAQANSIILTWQHNEVDGTDQTGYDLQYRLNGGAWTTVTDRASSISRRTFAAGVLPNGSVLDWQVRTYGQYNTTPAYSPWSAAATLTLSATPEAGVVFPDDVVPVDTSRITAQWSYYDEEGTTQAQWKVNLYTAGGATRLESRAGVGPATSLPLTTLLKDGTSYRLGVSVQDGTGLWSPETTQDFTVAYALPDVPTITLLWDATRAAVVATINNVTGGGGAEVDHNELWRSVDWETYELVEGNIPPNGTVTDYIPAIGTENVYLAIAVTAIEAAAESEPAVYETPETDGWLYINGGEAFAERVRVRYNPTLSRNFSRDKALHKFAGRKYPVETASEHRNREWNLGVAVLGDDDTTLEALERVADIPAPLVIRTPTRDRMFTSLEGIGSARENGYENVSMKLTQVDPPFNGSMPFEPVVYQTNYARMPIADAPEFAIHSGATGGVYTLSWLTGQTDGPTGLISAYGRATTVTRATGSSGGWMNYNSAATRSPMEGVTGDVVTISMYVRYTGSAPNASRTFRGYLYNGTTMVQNSNLTYTRLTGQWVRLKMTLTAVGNFDSVGWWDYFSGGDPAPDGSTFDVAGLFINKGPEPLEYFDGSNYEGDKILTARWSGAVNASTSQLTRGGVTT